MTSTPSPTWYDVLGVSREATHEQIKAAWRSATDKFEPGSGSGGQFRMFNEAADVLLDRDRRAAYDASLAAGAAPAGPAEDRIAENRVAEKPVVHAHPATHTDPRAENAEKRARKSAEKSAPKRDQGLPMGEPASRTAVGVAGVLALLTVAAIVLAVIFGLKVRTEAREADARDEAPAAAERAAKAILAYNYETLPADRKRASAYLSDDFRAKYLKNFSLLEKQKDGTPGAAVQTKTVVTSSVLGSGVVDAQEDVVRVLVYVNQVSKRPGKDPQIFQNRVAMTMEKDGNRWLVRNLKSY
jgi:Mce-associated membrane protein